jgi:hypothetical protein
MVFFNSVYTLSQKNIKNNKYKKYFNHFIITHSNVEGWRKVKEKNI